METVSEYMARGNGSDWRSRAVNADSKRLRDRLATPRNSVDRLLEIPQGSVWFPVEYVDNAPALRVDGDLLIMDSVVGLQAVRPCLVCGKPTLCTRKVACLADVGEFLRTTSEEVFCSEEHVGEHRRVARLDGAAQAYADAHQE